MCSLVLHLLFRLVNKWWHSYSSFTLDLTFAYFFSFFMIYQFSRLFLSSWWYIPFKLIYHTFTFSSLIIYITTHSLFLLISLYILKQLQQQQQQQQSTHTHTKTHINYKNDRYMFLWAEKRVYMCFSLCLSLSFSFFFSFFSLIFVEIANLFWIYLIMRTRNDICITIWLYIKMVSTFKLKTCLSKCT